MSPCIRLLRTVHHCLCGDMVQRVLFPLTEQFGVGKEENIQLFDISPFPFSLQSKPGCSEKAWAGGAQLWQWCHPDLALHWNLAALGQVFPVPPSLLPVFSCPLLQECCCPLTPHQSLPPALVVPQASKRRKVSFLLSPQAFPIHCAPMGK